MGRGAPLVRASSWQQPRPSSLRPDSQSVAWAHPIDQAPLMPTPSMTVPPGRAILSDLGLAGRHQQPTSRARPINQLIDRGAPLLASDGTQQHGREEGRPGLSC